jgi:hypothetical protein
MAELTYNIDLEIYHEGKKAWELQKRLTSQIQFHKGDYLYLELLGGSEIQEVIYTAERRDEDYDGDLIFEVMHLELRRRTIEALKSDGWYVKAVDDVDANGDN